MCPHTYVSSYYYTCDYKCVLAPLYMCPHTNIRVLILIGSGRAGEGDQKAQNICFTTICVNILLQRCPHTASFF